VDGAKCGAPLAFLKGEAIHPTAKADAKFVWDAIALHNHAWIHRSSTKKPEVAIPIREINGGCSGGKALDRIPQVQTRPCGILAEFSAAWHKKRFQRLPFGNIVVGRKPGRNPPLGTTSLGISAFPRLNRGVHPPPTFCPMSRRRMPPFFTENRRPGSAGRPPWVFFPAIGSQSFETRAGPKPPAQTGFLVQLMRRKTPRGSP